MFARYVISLTDRPVSAEGPGNEQSTRNDLHRRLGSLRQQLQQLLDNDLSPTSKQLYKRAQSLYGEFVKLHFAHEVLFPISVEKLSLFITFLNAKGYAPASISSYISALGYVHKLRDIPDPSMAFIIRRLLRSVHKTGRTGDSRLPITEPILLKLVQSLSSVTDSHYDEVMFKSMFLLAFYGFLRIGEITATGKGNQNNIQLEDIQLFGNENVVSRIEIKMQIFKWHKSSRPVILSIERVNNTSILCPVSALVAFLALRGTTSGPLYCYPPNKAVSRTFFCTVLARAVDFSGYDRKLYKSHSFRVGAATKASGMGFSELEIQHMGRWGSNSAYKNYVRISLTKSCAV